MKLLQKTSLPDKIIMGGANFLSATVAQVQTCLALNLFYSPNVRPAKSTHSEVQVQVQKHRIAIEHDENEEKFPDNHCVIEMS